MKECCRTGDQEPTPKYKPWLKWFVYVVIAGMVTFVMLNQINN
ncbi:hypothetical protein [uncultured Pontibacter sp.]|nr:hypothetical protein [uncultured Pontibacter sp.]